MCTYIVSVDCVAACLMEIELLLLYTNYFVGKRFFIFMLLFLVAGGYLSGLSQHRRSQAIRER